MPYFTGTTLILMTIAGKAAVLPTCMLLVG